MGTHVDLVSLFSNTANIKKIEGGDAVFQQGQAGDCMYVILSGEIEIRVDDLVVERVVHGEIIGEMALLDTARRSASAIAVRTSEVVAIDRESFLELVRTTPCFALDVMGVIAHRLRRMNRQV